MSSVLLAAGSLLILAVLLDVLWTTVAAGAGAGPLTARWSTLLWHSALRLRRRGSHRFLQLAGLSLTLGIIGVWMVLLWAGWTMAFMADARAVLMASTDTPADGWARVYYAGYVIFTLGNGDYRPGSAPWQMATVVASGTGLVLVTLSITYLLSVTSAITNKRQVAGYIWGLGDAPDETSCAPGTGPIWSRWAAPSSRSRQQYRPSLSGCWPTRCCTTRTASSAAAPRRRASSSSTSCSPCCTTASPPTPACPRSPPTRCAGRSPSCWRRSKPPSSNRPSTPRRPRRSSRCEPRGFPTVCDDDFAQALDGLALRRRLLLGLVSADGWDWDAVWAAKKQ